MINRFSKSLIVKLIAVSAALVVFSACVAEKEVVRHPPPPVQPPPVEVAPAPEPVVTVLPKPRTSLECFEDTKKIFNSCGIEVLPFVRTAFFDMDGDGVPEMVAGSKDGSLRLYKNYGTDSDPEWRNEEDYFKGIAAGAFSSPAIGDIDNDGKPEVIVGTGGFSSDSGRVLIFRNTGTAAKPVWIKIDMPEVRVGNDASPALLYESNDGRPDLVVGNSEGRLFLFRNRFREGRIAFRKDADFFSGLHFGMYVTPAAASTGDKIHIIAGNDLGKLYLLEKTKGQKGLWNKVLLKIPTSRFVSPAFIRTGDPKRPDLVVSEGSGQIRYFRNRRGNYREWEESSGLFSGRVLPGPVCTPVMAEHGGRKTLVVGNIHGEIKLFGFEALPAGLPLVERPGFFAGVKLPGFSKGVLTEWQGNMLLVTGQQDGVVRAFINAGSPEKPSWAEQPNFFKGLPKMMHASPAVFDLDEDGKWELIVGDAAGHVYGFHYSTGSDGKPAWEMIKGSFEEIKVGRFAAPALFKDDDTLYLLVGEQDGRINVFTAGYDGIRPPVFHKEGLLKGIYVSNHSAPSVIARDGLAEIAVGDYNGNLKHFSCRKATVGGN